MQIAQQSEHHSRQDIIPISKGEVMMKQGVIWDEEGYAWKATSGPGDI